MWKVSNKTNKDFLDKFHFKILIPLFDFIIKLKEDSYSKASFEDFKKKSQNY